MTGELQVSADIRFLPCGEHAVLVEVPDLHAVLALDAAVRDRLPSPHRRRHPRRHPRRGEAAWAGVLDVVPAARTLLVTVAQREHLGPVRNALRAVVAEVDLGHVPAADGEVVEITVRYDGPDLDDVAAATGLSRREVVAAHTASTCRVGFGGFAPGFAYLVDGDPRLEVPRRVSPRTKVPAGSVALAGTYSGIYPRSSPGGWQIIGTTEAVLWDVHRDPPALLRPGGIVRFVQEGSS
ncbi:MAG: allophanate hydrolase subunit 1 [Ornithinibacter sp.]